MYISSPQSSIKSFISGIQNLWSHIIKKLYITNFQIVNKKFMLKIQKLCNMLKQRRIHKGPTGNNLKGELEKEKKREKVGPRPHEKTCT